MQQFVRNNKFRFLASAATCVHEQSPRVSLLPPPKLLFRVNPAQNCPIVTPSDSRSSLNGRSVVPTLSDSSSPSPSSPAFCARLPEAAELRAGPQITPPSSPAAGRKVELSRTGPSSCHFGTQFRADWSPVVVLEKSLGSEFELFRTYQSKSPVPGINSACVCAYVTDRRPYSKGFLDLGRREAAVKSSETRQPLD